MFIGVGCCKIADLRSGFNCWNFSCNFAICVRRRGERGRLCIVLSHFAVSCRKLLKELDKNLGHMINVYIILMWKVYRGIGWYRRKLESIIFTFMWPCIVTNFFIIKSTRCTNFTNLFWRETLHVSNSSSVQHAYCVEAWAGAHASTQYALQAY